MSNESKRIVDTLASYLENLSDYDYRVLREFFDYLIRSSTPGTTINNTDQLPEGVTNLYYTTARVTAATTGKVDKPSPATDNAVVRFDGTSGAMQNSLVTINDAGDLLVPSTTSSTSSTSGSIVTGGGLGVGNHIRAAGDLHCRFVFAPGTGTNSIRLGNATAAGNNGTSAGNGASAGGDNSIALGLNSSSAGSSSVALGSGASATSAGSNSVALGASSVASGANATALGPVATASASLAVAIGRTTTSSHQGSVVIGSNVSSTATSQFIVSGGASNPISNVFFGAGVAATTPTPTTINGTGGSGTDSAGSDLRLAGGKSTGTAAGGSILFQVSPASGGSGSTQNALLTVATVNTSGLTATSFRVGANQVVGARDTGWTAATGTALKGAYDTATATTTQNAQRIKAIEDALRTHGLIN